jgi:hypothetical protein
VTANGVTPPGGYGRPMQPMQVPQPVLSAYHPPQMTSQYLSVPSAYTSYR